MTADRGGAIPVTYLPDTGAFPWRLWGAMPVTRREAIDYLRARGYTRTHASSAVDMARAAAVHAAASADLVRRDPASIADRYLIGTNPVPRDRDEARRVLVEEYRLPGHDADRRLDHPHP